MTEYLTFHTSSQEHSYEVAIGAGQLRSDRFLRFCHHFQGSIALITHENLADTLGRRVKDLLQRAGIEITLLSFPPGEEHKTRHTKAQLEDQLLERRFGKDSLLLALGGGVVTDVVGFTAATYARGVPWIALPTTLLGMVDASLGGKTGCNTPYGKNLVGALHPPQAVFMDTEVLHSLPQRECRNGFAEMIKHSLLYGDSVFSFLETHADLLIALDPPLLERAIADSCLIKRQIVEQDENESGMRRLLNFGHTVGHALESASKYTLSHGEAVAMGLLVESHIAMSLEYLSFSTYSRLQALLHRYFPGLTLPEEFDIESLWNAMAYDKKALHSVPRFVLIRDIGQPLSFEGHYCTEVDPQVVKGCLREGLYPRAYPTSEGRRVQRE